MTHLHDRIPQLEIEPLWEAYRRQRGGWLAFHLIPELVIRLRHLGCHTTLSADADSVDVLASGWSKVKLLVEIPPGVGWELRTRLSGAARQPYFEMKELAGGRRFEGTDLDRLIARAKDYQSPSPEASMQSLRAQASTKLRISE